LAERWWNATRKVGNYLSLQLSEKSKFVIAACTGMTIFSAAHDACIGATETSLRFP
jgi:hypothetical protein